MLLGKTCWILSYYDYNEDKGSRRLVDHGEAFRFGDEIVALTGCLTLERTKQKSLKDSS